MADQKPTLTQADELAARLSRMQRLQEDLDAAIGNVEAHRKELERIKRETAEIAESIDRQKQRQQPQVQQQQQPQAPKRK